MNSSQTKISEHNTHSHTKVQLLLIVGAFLTFHIILEPSADYLEFEPFPNKE